MCILANVLWFLRCLFLCSLRALIDAGLQGVAYSSLFDPISVATCKQAGVGASLELAIGGRCEPALGEPITVQAVVQSSQ